MHANTKLALTPKHVANTKNSANTRTNAKPETSAHTKGDLQ